MDALIKASMAKMHAKKLEAGDIDADLFLANATTIYEGVKKGYATAGKEGDTISESALAKLKINVFTAAAFKQHKNNVEIAALLVDEDGKQRSFAQFEKLAKPLLDTYNKTNLASEYNLADMSSQAAAKWATYAKRGGKLKYKTVGDGNVRDSHALLNGTTKSIDDDFWNYHYPPNGWRCRCFVQWVTDDTADVEPKGTPEIPPAFQNNVGKTNKIFNDKHPYFEDVAQKLTKALIAFAEKSAAATKDENPT